MKIGIFTTSSPVQDTKINYQFLNERGIEVYQHPSSISDEAYYSPKAIEIYVQMLHELFLDNSIDIVMSFWGGLNSNRLLNKIDYNLIKKHYKPLVGFSDTTALLLAVHKMTKNITYLGPAGITFLKPEPIQYSYDYFERTIIKKESNILIKDSVEYADDAYYLRPAPENNYRNLIKNPGHKTYRHGVAEGEIIAGNLQTLLVLAGTAFSPLIGEKILFLEEDETITIGYLHRFLTHLSQIEDFSRIRGFAFGRLSTQSNISDSELEKIFQEIFEGINIPIIYNMDFGHTDPMFTIPIGGTALFDTLQNKIILSQ